MTVEDKLGATLTGDGTALEGATLMEAAGGAMTGETTLELPSRGGGGSLLRGAEGSAPRGGSGRPRGRGALKVSLTDWEWRVRLVFSFPHTIDTDPSLAGSPLMAQLSGAPSTAIRPFVPTFTATRPNRDKESAGTLKRIDPSAAGARTEAVRALETF